MADLGKRKRFLFDLVRVSLPAFKDYWLKFKTSITKENPIGIYVNICNSSEVNRYFKDCVAGGYTGWIQIKLFARENCSNYEECAEEIIIHEVLHQVLDQVVGHEAKMALDNIHQPFYVYDEVAKKWRFVLKFVGGKKVNKVIQII
jgi:hypothetical protein